MSLCKPVNSDLHGLSTYYVWGVTLACNKIVKSSHGSQLIMNVAEVCTSTFCVSKLCVMRDPIQVRCRKFWSESELNPDVPESGFNTDSVACGHTHCSTSQTHKSLHQHWGTWVLKMWTWHAHRNNIYLPESLTGGISYSCWLVSLATRLHRDPHSWCLITASASCRV